MKKIVLFLALTLALAFAACACAQQTPAAEPSPAPQETENAELAGEAASVQLITGTVIAVTDEGVLIETEANGEVLVLTHEATVWETTGDIAAGDYIYVDYDGQMTFSLPAQISADVVRMHRLEGDIKEIYAEENAVLLSTEQSGEVYVRMPESWAQTEIDFSHMTVYFDGVMTMSLPGQINAGLVAPGYSLQGAISEIAEGYILIGEGAESVQVHIAEGQLPETAEVGTVVRVMYDGQMSRSIPAQITANEIVQISR